MWFSRRDVCCTVVAFAVAACCNVGLVRAFSTENKNVAYSCSNPITIDIGGGGSTFEGSVTFQNGAWIESDGYGIMLTSYPIPENYTDVTLIITSQYDSSAKNFLIQPDTTNTDDASVNLVASLLGNSNQISDYLFGTSQGKLPPKITIDFSESSSKNLSFFSKGYNSSASIGLNISSGADAIYQNSIHRYNALNNICITTGGNKFSFQSYVDDTAGYGNCFATVMGFNGTFDHIGEGLNNFQYCYANEWNIASFTNDNEFVAIANASYDYGACAATFGASGCSYAKSEVAAYGGIANIWNFSGFGGNNLFAARSNSLKNSAGVLSGSTVFGIGSISGKLEISGCWWTFGSFGENNKFIAMSMDDGQSHWAGCSIFGLGTVTSDVLLSVCCQWEFEGFGSNNSFTALSRAPFGAASCIFGGAHVGREGYDGSIFSDWTVEFNGSQTMVAMAAVPNDSEGGNAHIGTLGGCCNTNMQFYFSGDSNGGNDTSVVIAAMKLDEVLESTNIELACQARSIDSPNSRAIALGPNFQLNVGRKKNNDGYHGNGSEKMHIFGKIGKAPLAHNCNGSIMRIDNGWQVACYAPITDLQKIDIINGRLCLIPTKYAKISSACINQIENNTNLIQSNGNFDDYDNDYVQAFDVLNGDGLTFNNIDSIDSAGTLTLGVNQSLRFGIMSSSGSSNYELFGSVILHSANDKYGKINFSGGKVGFIMNNSEVDSIDKLGNDFEFPLIIASKQSDTGDNFNKFFSGISLGSEIKGKNNYYHIDLNNNLIIDNKLTPYTEFFDADKVRLLCRKIVVGNDETYVLVLTNRDALEELDELKIKHDNDIDAIQNAYLTKSDASSTYLSKSDASSTYLNKTDASNTYQAKGDYLTTTGASETYQEKGDYLTTTDASETYLSQDTAATTYVTQDALLAAIVGNEESPTEGGTFTELLGEKLAGYVTKNELSEIFSENGDSDFGFVREIAKKLDGYVTEEELISALKDVFALAENEGDNNDERFVDVASHINEKLSGYVTKGYLNAQLANILGFSAPSSGDGGDDESGGGGEVPDPTQEDDCGVNLAQYIASQLANYVTMNELERIFGNDEEGTINLATIIDEKLTDYATADELADLKDTVETDYVTRAALL
ncbi:MAG: hypothetical protein LBI69_02140, partial [Puniceicoccales bacterium]|nr:hypothetical protein [Puniceicoccales bacterium]